jgi:hypothetical protein
MALRPFFIVTSAPFVISCLALHFTQYPSIVSYRGERHIKQTAGLF